MRSTTRAYNFSMENRDNSGFWYGFNITAFILIGFFLCFIPFTQALLNFAKTVDISMVQTSTSTFAVALENKSAVPLNALEFEVSFNPKEFRVSDIVPLNTLCEERFIISKNIQNASGTAHFACGTVTPFTGTEGTFAVVYGHMLKAGTTSITFGTSTQVLAHDGLGTNATRNLSSLLFTNY